MKTQIVGDYLLEFFVITLLLLLSLALVIPFIPMVVGITGYFKRDIHSRRFKDIFSTQKENWKILIFYTLFELTILVVATLNIYYFNQHLETATYFILVVSYIAFLIGIVYLVTAPTIIVHMNVTFRQLLFNGFMLIFGGIKNSLLALGMLVLILVLILYFPYVVPFLGYFVLLVSQKLMMKNFKKLKAKVLGVRYEDLEKKETDDEYVSELLNL